MLLFLCRITSKRKDISDVNEVHTNLVVAIGLFQIFFLARVAIKKEKEVSLRIH